MVKCKSTVHNLLVFQQKERAGSTKTSLEKALKICSFKKKNLIVFQKFGMGSSEVKQKTELARSNGYIHVFLCPANR